MPAMVLDPSVRRQLSELTEMTELRDENGRLVGHYIPAQPPCPWEPELTEAEIQRRIGEPGGTTLAEFWRRQDAA